MLVELLYFARIRDALGRDTERVDTPSHVRTAADAASALAACAFLAEALRNCAPFWRKELPADGAGRWR